MDPVALEALTTIAKTDRQDRLFSLDFLLREMRMLVMMALIWPSLASSYGVLCLIPGVWIGCNLRREHR